MKGNENIHSPVVYFFDRKILLDSLCFGQKHRLDGCADASALAKMPYHRTPNGTYAIVCMTEIFCICKNFRIGVCFRFVVELYADNFCNCPVTAYRERIQYPTPLVVVPWAFNPCIWWTVTYSIVPIFSEQLCRSTRIINGVPLRDDLDP